MLKIILLLLVSVQNLNALLCYSKGSFYFSRHTFNWNDFSSILFNIKNEVIANNSICNVRITIDYNGDRNNYVVIKFGSPTHQHNTNIEFGSTIFFHKNDILSIVSYFDYSCSSGDFCDRIFLNNWAKRLLNSNDNSLHTSFTSLWKTSHSSTSICNAKQATNECTSHLCFNVYDELKNFTYGKAQCKDKSSTNPVYIHIKTFGENSNDYQCIKNHCTGEVSYNSTLDKMHAWQSINNVIMMNSTELNEIIFIRAISIVGVLLFIGGVAYCIQIRKYRKGYRLATIA
ncbi:unnamed protein product [Rotaria socialis]|uniref:Uncharacterized protein n=1 Tax=Rotaria socialis TaxID=392032 RepID=A0A820ZT38_9BILA|nr:unnamed protein product [Rotaria socialis]CAF4566880.1 unnamed protein product [Rotaria socialis]